ncbi:hypothetical protein TSAR_001543 [Trichomalopsis sarcophagae]|uniref:Uncharacterized protein n=1 Tax=Trichomalopsis sarcophagae TaxID=543379 RepID=A0A232ELS0_9HYME|nr:hypothetical protein TSAR_001543 [Trichomalopsis sarcophagae]
MDSIKRADSTHSISSIVSDSSPNNDDPEIKTKTNSMLKLILEAISDTNAESSALGNEVLELLNILKFDTKSLPTDIREGLQTTSAILKSEGLPAVDETALQLCLEKKKIQSKMKEREERLLKAKYNAAFAKYNALQEKLNRIRKEIEEIEDTLQLKMSNDENTESDRILWSNRLHDYKDAIKKMEQELDTLQSKEIGLDSTLQKSSLLMNKLNDLSQLNSSLKRYGDLPPNLLQAKIMLESKTQELEEIENLIYEKMNN